MYKCVYMYICLFEYIYIYIYNTYAGAMQCVMHTIHCTVG